MSMTREQFIKMYERKAIHCKTKALAKEFVELAKKLKLGFRSDEIHYYHHKEKTAYYPESNTLMYGDIDYAKIHNYEIIEFTGENNQSKKERAMKVKEFENDGKVMNITVSRMMRKLGIKNVIFNEEKKTTVVFLNGGGKGISKMAENESFDPIVALSVAYTLAVATNGNKKNFKQNVAKMLKRFRV